MFVRYVCFVVVVYIVWLLLLGFVAVCMSSLLVGFFVVVVSGDVVVL